ncbi:MAG: S8 family serine peptidase [Chloroflexota bacterium]|nr:S8 family serine peptidase [Chloroflexota bacterium]
MPRPVAPLLSLLLILTALLVATQPVAAAPPVAGKRSTESVAAQAPDRVVVGFRSAGSANAVQRAHGLTRASDVRAQASDQAVLAPDQVVLKTNGRPVEQVITELQADPAVAWAEPDYRVEVTGGAVTAVAVNDPRSANQYSLDRMRVRDAWSFTRGGASVVAVLDTGTSFVHADLAGRIYVNPGESGSGRETNGRDDDGNGFIDDVNGWDFVNADRTPADDHNHGTWVSGVIAANPDNRLGIAGISWTDKILPVKVMDSAGSGFTSDLARGIRYAADRGADVINMSVGGFPYDTAVKSAIDYAWSKGAVLVGAAGNNRQAETFYPASYPNVISVTATQADDEFTNWSSYGTAVDVSAPGADIQTTDCGGCSTTRAGGSSYASVSGTSFATPNTAGVVALIRARYPTWTNQQVVDRLLATVDDLGYTGWDNRYGAGRVNALRAVGGAAVAVVSATADTFEPNNTIANARALPLGTTWQPTIHPASDLDHFAFSVPRAGRLEVTVTPLVDNVRSSMSSLPIDPIVDAWNSAGAVVGHSDDPTNSAAVESMVLRATSAARFVVRVMNWFPNGSLGTYSVRGVYVDDVAPVVSSWSPAPGSTHVPVTARVDLAFSEPVTGVDTATLTLRDAADQPVPASVSYASAQSHATLTPLSPLRADAQYRIVLSSTILDQAGNSLAAASSTFTTAKLVTRIAGADRYATAANLSAVSFAPGAPVAYLASGESFPDALSGGPVAGRDGGPILLLTHDTIPSPTANELHRLAPGRIVLLGGPGSVSDLVATQLAGYTSGGVTRIAGADRYATAANLSAASFARGVSVAYLASGQSFPDALAGGPVAGRDGGPILLLSRDAIPQATADELARLAPGRIVLLGGSGIISDGVAADLAPYTSSPVTRIAGADRYATAAQLSAASFAADGAATVYVATGTNYPDGLSAGPVAGRAGVPILLLPTNSLPAAVANELRRLNPAQVIIVGGTAGVSTAVQNAIAALWN